MKTKKSLHLLFVGLLSIAVAAPLCAQVDNPSSSTFSMTNGAFAIDIDNFMDVNYWNTVKPESWFGYLRLMNPDRLQGGFAKQFNKLYVASYYTGNLVPDFSKEDTSETILNSGTTTVDTEKVSYDSGFYNYNNFWTLFGIGNWGIKAGILTDAFSNQSTVSSSDNVAGTKLSVVYNNIYLEPSLSAGTSFVYKNSTFLPWIYVSYKYNPYIYTISGTAGDGTSGAATQYIKMQIGSRMDTGDVDTLFQHAEASLSFFPVWSDDAILTAHDNASNTDYTSSREYNENYLIFRPAYSVKKRMSDTFVFSAKAELFFEYKYSYNGHSDTVATTNGTETTYYGRYKRWNPNKNIYEDEDDVYDVTTNFVEFQPTLSCGTQFAIKPEVFYWNTGVKVTLPYIESTTTTTTTDIQTAGETAKTDYSYSKTEKKISYGYIYFKVSTGFLYKMTKNITFDYKYDIFISPSNMTLNYIWNNSTMNLSVSMKY